MQAANILPAEADMPRIPDFFIVGAPKCGTTAIYSYLGSHPGVFLPKLKEPHYFSFDLPELKRITGGEAYRLLFVSAPDGALVGEASASYLFSSCAIEHVMAHNPRARIIAILRNPIDMAYALHAERLYNLNEDVADFEEAWSLQEERASGRCIPKHCREPRLLQYRAVCSFAVQIERLFRAVPEEQRAVFLFEEFTRRPGETYSEILQLLKLPDDGREQFEHVNSNKVLRSGVLAKWHRSARAALKRSGWYDTAKAATDRLGLHPSRALSQWYIVHKPRRPLSARFRAELAKELASEVRELEHLLGRTLECWCDFYDLDRSGRSADVGTPGHPLRADMM